MAKIFVVENIFCHVANPLLEIMTTGYRFTVINHSHLNMLCSPLLSLDLIHLTATQTETHYSLCCFYFRFSKEQHNSLSFHIIASSCCRPCSSEQLRRGVRRIDWQAPGLPRALGTS